MTLQSQPDERLNDLVGAQQQRQRSQPDVSMPSLGIVDRTDADCADDDPPTKSACGEKHTSVYLGHMRTPPIESRRNREGWAPSIHLLFLLALGHVSLRVTTCQSIQMLPA